METGTPAICAGAPNNGTDRSRECIEARDGKGDGNLEGYELFGTMVEPAGTFKG